MSPRALVRLLLLAIVVGLVLGVVAAWLEVRMIG